jgi:hypothetical protein
VGRTPRTYRGVVLARSAILVVAVGISAACGSDGVAQRTAPTASNSSATDSPDAATLHTDDPVRSRSATWVLTPEHMDQALAIVRADPDLAALAGPEPSLQDTAPWTNRGSTELVGAVTWVPLLGAPRDLDADLRGYECIDGRMRGGVFRIHATGVSLLMVWIDFASNAVVAIGSDGRRSDPGERLADAYFPDGDCQNSD